LLEALSKEGASLEPNSEDEMSTMANTVMVLRHPKDAVRYPARAQSVDGPGDLQCWSQFFAACGGGMAPGAPGETRISIYRGSTDAAPAFASQLVTFASVLAATVIEVNGVKFTAFNGAGGGTGTFTMAGTDAADATAFCAAVTASTAAGVLGVVRAANLAGTIQCTSVAAGDNVTIGGRKFTATAYATGRIGEFSSSGTDTADATALAAAINADPWLSRQVLATSSTDTVTVRQYSGTTGLTCVASAATFTLGGLSSGKLAAVAVALLSASQPGAAGNGIVVKTLGVAASATLTCASVVITDTVVVNGQTFTAIKQRATGTLTAVSAVVGDVCVVGGITFTGVAGATGVAKPTSFSIDTSDTAAAADLVTQINAHPSLSGIVTATSVAGVVTVRAVTSGTAGNSIVLTGTAVRLAASGSGVLAGGIAVANNQFDVSPGGTNDQVAVDLARAINASTTTLVASYVRAQRTASGVVTVYSLIAGRAGNGISLTTTGGTITASSALLAGATLADLEGTQASCTLTLASVLNAQTVTINGVVYTAHTNTQANDQFDISGSDTADAANLCLAINNSTTAGSAEIIATSAAAVVTVKARKGGIAGNLITVAVSNATVTIGGSAASGRLGGGAAATTVVPAAERLSGGVGGDATSPAVFQF
jgi:hypothetical protein